MSRCQHIDRPAYTKRRLTRSSGSQARRMSWLGSFCDSGPACTTSEPWVGQLGLSFHSAATISAGVASIPRFSTTDVTDACGKHSRCTATCRSSRLRLTSVRDTSGQTEKRRGDTDLKDSCLCAQHRAASAVASSTKNSIFSMPGDSLPATAAQRPGTKAGARGGSCSGEES